MTPQTTRVLAIRLDDEGIIRVKVHPGAQMGLADAIEGNRIIWAVSGERRRPLLCDYTEIRSQDLECRKYYAGSETARICLACALQIASPVSRVIGNFYMGLNKPATPTRLFDTEEGALDWLRDFMP